MKTPLPIHQVIPQLREALREHSRVILQADPGAGKSTVVPLKLMNEPWLKGRKILLLEPRRLAARMVAERMAGTLGEATGAQIGYRMRGDVRSGEQTRIEVVTEGVLSRMLLADPALEEVGAIIFDEFHERSLQSDLGLALTLQAQELLREELRILVMSATLDREALSRLLGSKTPIISSRGRAHPVNCRYLAPQIPLPVPRELPDRTASLIRQALDEEEGSILAFLPGAAEIRRCAELLRRRIPSSVIIAPLYGALSPAEQHRAVAPAPAGTRKVVLATNIAETSLTIEGIRIVIDSGYERQVRYDASRGMNRMRTVPISASSAEQRAGRAGRTAPGVCYRLWNAKRPLAPQSEAEIVRADLASLRLELAAWGAEASELAWSDPPPDHALQNATDLLHRLEMLEYSGTLTPLGEAALRLGEHPRIAHMLLQGRKRNLGYEAALLSAILSERPTMQSSDLSEEMETIQRKLRQNDPSLKQLARTLAQTLRKLKLSPRSRVESRATGLLIALAYPERIALRRSKGTRYRSAGGRGMRLRPGDTLERCDLLAVAEAGGQGSEAIIRRAAPLQREDLESLALIGSREDLRFNPETGRVEARRVLHCDTLILESRPLPRPDPKRLARVLLEGIRQQGPDCLPWEETSRMLRQRVHCARLHRSDPWPDWSDDALTERMEEWLLPYLEGIDSIDGLTKLDLGALLEAALGWERKRELDRLLPPSLELPAGNRVAIDYSDPETPTLSARLQELIGWTKTPKVLEGQLPLSIHLLSPARRPLAVTRDLESFWRQVYPEVRKEMRGRYPKHYWPEDPFHAEAVRGGVKRK